jgi:hypothetical protein
VLRLRAVPGALPLGAVLATIGIVAGLAVGWLHLDHLPFSICVFKALTGWPCPTCGATRALGLLFRGDLPGAFRMSPLATLVAAALLVWGLADLALMPRGRAFAVELSPSLAVPARAAALLALLGNWAYLIAAGR